MRAAHNSRCIARYTRLAAARESAPTRRVGCSRSAATRAAREGCAPPNEQGIDRFGAPMRHGRQFENVSLERAHEKVRVFLNSVRWLLINMATKEVKLLCIFSLCSVQSITTKSNVESEYTRKNIFDLIYYVVYVIL